MIPTRKKTDRAIGNISRTYPPGPNQMVLVRGKSVRALRSNKNPILCSSLSPKIRAGKYNPTICTTATILESSLHGKIESDKAKAKKSGK